MMKQRKTGRIVLAVILTAVVAAFAAGMVYSRYGGWGTGKCADVEEFAKYAAPVDAIGIPAGVRIVALGEATHGNAEFQQLKLEVFRQLVEREGVRAFALEGDYGGCATADRYIHGGEGSAQGAVAAIGFPIYRTDQMAQLLEWMRQYNATAPEGEDLRLYGFDMQQLDWNHHHLLEAAREYGIDASSIAQRWDSVTGMPAVTYTAEQLSAGVAAIKDSLLQHEGSEAAVHHADIMLQNCALSRVAVSGAKYNALRDSLMAENIQWVLRQEEARGHRCIFVSAHNGHIERTRSYGTAGKNTGNLLADAYGDEYYAIGTDFYRSRCNLPNISRSKRISHTFYSHDPLAKAAKRCGYATCWLDFAKLPDGSALQRMVAAPLWMGSVGEGYSPLMVILPRTYRLYASPASLYDGMIFVPDAHPTAPWQ